MSLWPVLIPWKCLYTSHPAQAFEANLSYCFICYHLTTVTTGLPHRQALAFLTVSCILFLFVHLFLLGSAKGPHDLSFLFLFFKYIASSLSHFVFLGICLLEKTDCLFNGISWVSAVLLLKMNPKALLSSMETLAHPSLLLLRVGKWTHPTAHQQMGADGSVVHTQWDVTQL